MHPVIVLSLTLAVASAAIPNSDRIIGGSATSIRQYPEIVQLLGGTWGWFDHYCAGVILNNRAILSAAHCTEIFPVPYQRIRYGSSYRSSGGTVLTVNRVIEHPLYNHRYQWDNDISILWVNGIIPVTDTSRPARIAGSNYNVADNQIVWAAGWGQSIIDDFYSFPEQLHHVQIWTVNQDICRHRYANRVVNGIPRPAVVTDNMLCSGWLDVGGRDQCQGDSGGPLYHNGVVVGICSWGDVCASAQFPGVNARVSRYTNWINQNR
ncbi:hypothetical protein ABMA28_006791 [Loxostege sticticalis]|uniref:Peptidase S1 domain-containing protein n=1 Tax=Loxostege sticticalis TaxID=481309 RepID=A0ABD0TNR8_LOXSC